MKVLLDRWQFGVTITYHFLFVPLTIGLAADQGHQDQLGGQGARRDGDPRRPAVHPDQRGG
jgi:hypothetical protein